MAKAMSKRSITKAHKIARAVSKSGSGVRNPYAVGMATQQKHLKKQRAKRGR